MKGTTEIRPNVDQNVKTLSKCYLSSTSKLHIYHFKQLPSVNRDLFSKLHPNQSYDRLFYPKELTN